MKFNPWNLTSTAVFIAILYVVGFGIVIAPDRGPIMRSLIWAFVPFAGVISTIALLKETGPKGVYNSVLFGVHLANVALAIVMVVMLLFLLPGIMRTDIR